MLRIKHLSLVAVSGLLLASTAWCLEQPAYDLLIQNGATGGNNGISITMLGENNSTTVTGANTQLIMEQTTNNAGVAWAGDASGSLRILDGGLPAPVAEPAEEEADDAADAEEVGALDFVPMDGAPLHNVRIAALGDVR